MSESIVAEVIAVGIVSMAVGAGIMKLALKNKKIEQKIDRSERKKLLAMKDPELLLKKLNENGIMVDDGDEISFAIEEKDGEKQLVQKVKKGAVAPGEPKIRKTTSNESKGDQKKTVKKVKKVSKNVQPKPKK